MSPNDNEQERRGDHSVQGRNKPLVIGIGASPDRIQALQAFFDAFPDRLGDAFVVVVHHDPHTQSELARILAARTAIPASQVFNPTSLEPRHIYVIPPNRRLRITDNEIAALEFDEPRAKRSPIDLFFHSLAHKHGDGFVITLTGVDLAGKTEEAQHLLGNLLISVTTCFRMAKRSKSLSR
jgi:two-component system CheB/CheR fusion protein